MGRTKITDDKNNIIGTVINNWLVKKRDFTKNKLYYILECTCGCNENVSVRSDNLKRFNRKCKVLKKKLKLEKHRDREEYKTRLIGKKFGNLIVIDFGGYNKRKQILYLCECQCNNKTLIKVTYTNLVKGNKDNCGCLTSKKMSESKRKYNTYDLTGEYGIGYTSKGEEFYFDLEDYDKIKDYCWRIHDGYVETRYNDGENYKIIKMHRLIMNVTDSIIKVDHIYHEINDNRKYQLRLSTNSQNCMNHIIHSDNTSGYSGVNWDSEKSMWRARIWKEWKCYHLGYYNNLEDAVAVRDKAENIMFQEYKYKEKHNDE